MYRRPHLSIAVLAAVVTLSTIHAVAQAADPVSGTWVLNVAKSKFSPGPAPKSESRTYVVSGEETRATRTGTDADGKPTAGEWTMVYDGKDRPMIGEPGVDTLAVKRVEGGRVTFTEKKAGQVVITGTRTISSDGKVMTIAAKGTNDKGQPFHNLMVFDKQ